MNDAQTVWIVDAHRDGKRFIVCADEKLTAFVELESAIRRRGHGVLSAALWQRPTSDHMSGCRISLSRLHR